MKIPHTKFIRLTMPFFVFFLLFACSKDTDLLADYVVADVQEAKLLSGLVQDDFFISTTSGAMTLDVLANDEFANPENVKIVEISTPTNGTVVVNEDKTLTYTPSDTLQENVEDNTQTEEGVQNTEAAQSTGESQNTEEIATEQEQEEPTSQENQTIEEIQPEETQAIEETQPEETQTIEETQPEVTENQEDTTAPKETETQTEEETTDSFSYTTETTNEDETTTTQTGTVTVVTNRNYGELKAFPKAFGAGSNVTGARGGSNSTVYRVTNLNNSGYGSFRDAVSQSNRYIVFDVSGTIRLTSGLTVTADNLTIAGQTAPSGGISITGRRMQFQDVDNLIVRYVRFRPVWDHSKFDIDDALECTRVTNAIFDHISVSWGMDEAISFVGSLGSAPNKRFATYNITLQNSLIADSGKGMIVGYSNYQDQKFKGTTGGDFSVNRNVFAHISHRFPTAVTDDRVDVINNVVHDWRNKTVGLNPPSKIKINIINNYYQKGNQINNVISKGKMVHLDYDTNAAHSIYAAGNIIGGEFTDPNASNLSQFHWWTQGPYGSTTSTSTGTLQVTAANASGRFSGTSFPQLNNSFAPISAQDALNSLPDEVGAYAVIDANGNKVIGRDVLDIEFISNVKTNKGINHNYYQNRSQTSRYINYYNSVSTTPINTHPSNWDTDGDGMPNAWENVNGSDPNQKDHNEDPNNNGYSNLEEYLNMVDF